MTLSLRPRSDWEAVDTGFALARAHFLPLFMIGASCFLGFSLIAHAVAWWASDGDFTHGAWNFCMLFYWWLKPLVERLQVYYLGHAMFGDKLGVGFTLRQAPRIWRQSGWFGALFWLPRLSPIRSYTMPIRVLEGLHGKARSARMRQFTNRKTTVAGMLTVIMCNFEFALMSGLAIFVGIFLPAENGIQTNFVIWFQALTGQTDSILGAAWIVVSAISEPLIMAFTASFYVGGGFALYLQRRTDLEGWDIELGLRRIDARLAALTSGMGHALRGRAMHYCVLWLTLTTIALAVLVPQQSDAAPPAPHVKRCAEDDTPAQCMRTIARDPVYGKEETIKNYAWRFHDEAPKKKSRSWLDRLLGDNSAFDAFKRSIAVGGRILLWLLGILFALYLSLKISRHMGWLRWSPKVRQTSDIAVSANAATEKLPPQIAAAARALLDEGQTRAALSLLLRGAVRSAHQRGWLPLKTGDTESDYLRKLDPQAPVRAEFDELIGLWRHVAYGQGYIDAQRCIQLIERWQPWLGSAGKAIVADGGSR